MLKAKLIIEETKSNWIHIHVLELCPKYAGFAMILIFNNVNSITKVPTQK